MKKKNNLNNEFFTVKPTKKLRINFLNENEINCTIYKKYEMRPKTIIMN